MNKYIKNFFFYIVLAFMLCLTCAVFANAYNSSNILHYYSFDDSVLNNVVGIDNFTDSIGNNNLNGTSCIYEYASWRCLTSISGIKGNGILMSNSVNMNNQINGNIENLNSLNKFSINLWAKGSGQYFINILNSNNTLSQSTFITALGTITLKNGVYNVILQTPYTLDNQWNMITITYNDNTNFYSLYLNGELKSVNQTLNAFNSTRNILSIFNTYDTYSGTNAIDELSIWNTDLNIYDVAQLYNNGNGLNESQTINGTLYNINSSINSLCIDNNHLCNNPLFIDGFYYCNVNVDNSSIKSCGSCINYIIDNTTNSSYISTFNNCNTYFRNSTTKYLSCSLFSDFSIFNHDFMLYNPQCNISTNTVTLQYSNCSNNDIASILNNNPNDAIYSIGICQNYTCQDTCNNINFQDCLNDYSTEKCVLNPDTGCLYEQKQFDCNINEQCVEGSCIAIGTQLSNGGIVGGNGNLNLFAKLTINQKYSIMILLSVIVVLLFTIIMASFGDATSGLLVGLVISMIVSLTLSIIMQLTLLIPILYIIIGGAIVTVLFRRMLIG